MNVKELQKALYDKGYFDTLVTQDKQSYKGREDKAVDGFWGRNSKKAYALAQKDGWQWDEMTKSLYGGSSNATPSILDNKYTNLQPAINFISPETRQVIDENNRKKLIARKQEALYNAGFFDNVTNRSGVSYRGNYGAAVDGVWGSGSINAMNAAEDAGYRWDDKKGLIRNYDDRPAINKMNPIDYSSDFLDESEWGTHEGGIKLPIRNDYNEAQKRAVRALNRIDLSQWGLSEADANRLAALTLSTMDKESSFGKSGKYLIRTALPESIIEFITGRKESKGMASIKDDNFYNPIYLDNRSAKETSEAFRKGDMLYFDKMQENALAKDLNSLGIDWKNRDFSPEASALTALRMYQRALQQNPDLDDASLYRAVFKGKPGRDVINEGSARYAEGAPSSKRRFNLDFISQPLDDIRYVYRKLAGIDGSNSYSDWHTQYPGEFDGIGSIIDTYSEHPRLLPRWYEQSNMTPRQRQELGRLKIKPNSEITLNLDRGKIDDYWSEDNPEGTIKPEVISDIYDQCARFANEMARGNIPGFSRDGMVYDVSGDAWNRDSTPIYNGYEHVYRPELMARRDYFSNYGYDAADDFKANFDFNQLDPNEMYDVNMYGANSGMYKTIIPNVANNRFGSHTGNLVNENGKWFVIHNRHGYIYKEPVENLLGSDRQYGITGVFKMRRKNRMGGKLIPKGQFGWLAELLSSFFETPQQPTKVQQSKDKEVIMYKPAKSSGKGNNLGRPLRPAIKIVQGKEIPLLGCAETRNFVINKGTPVNSRIYGHAWSGNGKTILNGYDLAPEPQNVFADSIKHKNFTEFPYYNAWDYAAADSVKNRFNPNTIDPNKKYYVNMYYSNSPAKRQAYSEQTDHQYNTHTGWLKNDTVYHAMPVNGVEYIMATPLNQLLGSKGQIGITGIREVK